MNAPLRNFLLSAVLIAVPASGFAVGEMLLSPTQNAQGATATGLGDLSAYTAIVNDTRKIASGGDLSAAEHRITDFETLWDDNAAALRKSDPGAWTAVDTAADATFAALRAKSPDPQQVDQMLATLQTTLASPTVPAATGAVQSVAGIPVTDGSGHALPCEEMIGQLRDALAGQTPSAAVGDLQSKALERCNADDDAHADAFAAQALSQIKG